MRTYYIFIELLFSYLIRCLWWYPSFYNDKSFSTVTPVIIIPCNSLTIFCSYFLPSCFNDVLDINQGTTIFSTMKYIHFSCILSVCNNSHRLIQHLMMDRYKLCYYRFGELTTEYGKPPG